MIKSPPFSSLDRVSGYLSYHVQRQKVIAGNLANIDTPGYRAQDLDFREVVRMEQNGDERTEQRKLDVFARIHDDETPDQDGNSVSLETQLAKSQANTLRFGAITELLKRRLGIMKYAATDGGR